MIPGEYLLRDEPIDLNPGAARVRVRVDNHGDRPIQVGSHTHFFEVNRFLRFDRVRALGYRLDIPAVGTEARKVEVFLKRHKVGDTGTAS